MKIYISGKITGDSDYRKKFARAEEEVRARGAAPINPAVLPGGLTQGDYMRICLAMIDCADGVLLLRDWTDSEGAKLEKAYAEKTGKPIVGVVEAGGSACFDTTNSGSNGFGSSGR